MAEIRNFKDFLQVYNHMSHTCFLHCVNDFNSRELTPDETSCTQSCILKHVKVNHKIMAVFMELEPVMRQQRLENMNKVASVDQQQQVQIKDQ